MGSTEVDSSFSDWAKTYNDEFFISLGDEKVIASMVQFIAEKVRGAFPAATPNAPIQVLDVGCGIGYYTGLIAQAMQGAAEITSLDPAASKVLPHWDLERFSQVPTPITKEGYRQYAASNPAKHHVESLEKSSFSSNSFDIIIGVFVIEYTDTALAAEELSRILRPNGQLLLILHSQDSTLFKGSKKASDETERNRVLFETIRSSLEKDEKEVALRAVETFRQASPDDPRLGSLLSFINIAFQMGPRALPKVDELAEEYNHHNLKLKEFVTGKSVFENHEAVSRFFQPYGFTLVHHENVGTHDVQFGRAVVLRKN